MKKVVVGVLILLIIGVSLFGIIYLLDPMILMNDEESTTTTKMLTNDYEVANSGKYFVSYQINQDIIDDFELDLNIVKIKYEDDELVINDEKVIKGVKIHRYFAIYEESMLVMVANNVDDNKAHIINYDIYNKEYEVLSSYNNMNVVLDSDIYFEDIGFIFNTSIVDGKSIIINNEMTDVCNIKDPKVIVKKTVEYLYDINTHEFDDFEELSSFNLDSYVTVNKLC